MRSYTFLLLAFCMLNSENLLSQVKNYEAQWKKIDELIDKKNLPKSALAEVKKIYAQAKKDENDVQLIKSLMYITDLQDETRENNEAESIKEIEKEIASAKEPARSILYSLLANLYWQYFQNNRYELYDRTNTTNFDKADIATWTIDDFHKKITELFLQSIKDQELLKKTKLEPFDEIISKGNLRYLRPTLFDLLAHKTLEYFKDDEHDIQKPAYAFEINEPKAFAPAPDFIQHKFITKDSLSLQQNALLIYQDLAAFHLNDAKPDALIDVEIERIEFVHDNATMENKNDLYKSALDNVIAKYPSNHTADQASFLLASYYNDLASGYDAHKDTTHRYDRRKAKEILEKLVKDSAARSEGWINSYNLLKQITKKSFSFSLEKVNIPNEPFRALINYTNIIHLNLRLIKATDALKNMQNDYSDIFWNTFIKATPIRSWKQLLPATNDCQQHSAEIKIDGLPSGEYFLLAAEDKFESKNKPLSLQLFYVSNISFIHNLADFFVLHRKTGMPLNNANVQIWERYYDYKTSTHKKEKTLQFRTDANGYFRFTQKKKTGYRYYYYFDITYNNERLFLDDPTGEYSVMSRTNIDTLSVDKFEKKYLYTYLFTDRSIYRPGQTVYFKGISVTKTKDGKSKIQPNYKNAIYLRNAHYEVVDSMIVTTNDYGSFSGKFQLPMNTMNGNFTLSMKDLKGQQSIQVEEYKRPKFFVEIEKIKGSYKVNDTIHLTGNAKAYAGNVVDEAKVSYRVVREARFLYDWLRWWQPESGKMEITHGEIETDATGKFSIQFAAIPDRSINKETEPVFDYHVYVDVTDINGETRSNETVITAGYKSLMLKTEVDERIPVDSFKTISVRAENMNGEYQPSLISVSVFKLVPEQRLIRNHLWDRPDQYAMNKQEFISYFPHDEYATESDFKTWQREREVYSRGDSTNVNGEWSMTNSGLPKGYYAIEIITKDKDGQQVKDVKYVELYDPGANQLSKPEYLWTKGSDKAIEPGEKTSIQIGTSADVFLVKRKDQPSSTSAVGYSFERISNQKKSFEFNATEADRGGYGMNFFFVRDNRLYSFNDVIEVQWSNKELHIEYSTFRDKTLPGSEEKWKVKITGYKNEKVAAEMLASMYDASLDQFYYHEWIKPYVWKTYENTVVWSRDNFSSIESREKWISNDDQEYSDWAYDALTFSMYDLMHRIKRVYLKDGRIIEKYGDIEIASQEGLKDENIVVGRIAMQKFTPPVIRKDMEMKYSLSSNYLMPDQKIEISMSDSIRFGDIDLSGLKQNSQQNKIDQTIQPRTNFNETAFFFPDLKTDENGAIEFSFTAPEALTKWKLQTLAHTKELAFGLSKKELVTQKQLMVQPNMPRFLRQGDKIELVSKIVNLSDEALKGQAQLELFNAATNQPLKGWTSNTNSNEQFVIAAGQSASVKFSVEVPIQFNDAVVWRVIAKSGSYSDAEENTLPVLSNRILVTETLPLPMRNAGTKNFAFDKLIHSGQSNTLQHQSLTVEYTSNPAWYAVQALPYLMEFPYECAEQTWNRYYANSLASKIANSSPRIKQIFEQWKTLDTAALLSNLQKNQELKSALLEETPWVLDAKSEEQQKKNIALLFDMVKMSNELRSNMNKLKDLLNSNGSFPWFKGGYEDRYITQYILTGIGHLKKLNAIAKGQEEDINSIVNDGFIYLDKKIKEDYDYLVRHETKLNEEHIDDIQIQYLYMRSSFPKPIPQTSQTAFDYYKKQAQTYWKNQSKYLQGMIALALYRSGDMATAKNILNSLKETSITTEELGMYWKDNSFGNSWYWSYAPIETQSLMIEAFNEINKDSKTVDDLKTWLIKNKQTNNWSTTKATADACYAMLLQGTDWLSDEPLVEIKLGNTIVDNKENKKEAGTGYFKQTISGEKVLPGMGNVSITVRHQTTNQKPQTTNSSWGSVYWQYFEDMDKITTASTPLQLTKKLFIEKNSDNGPILTPVEDGTKLHVGDKIKVRVELRVDRDMEYVHMKDMRASSLEPINVLSEYKWQGGLGYYESTKDASTNFFFDHLYKGTYVFEYPLFVSQAGNFSNGITTIQCMYAPEFSAHSEGVRIIVE